MVSHSFLCWQQQALQMLLGTHQARSVISGQLAYSLRPITLRCAVLTGTRTIRSSSEQLVQFRYQQGA